MAEVSVRDLRNHGGDVLDRVAGGERVVITRSGKRVAELRPIGAGLTADALIRRRVALPVVDLEAWRADASAIVDDRL